MREGWTEDVVVVGGGLAGLTAAALLAREGRQVTLLERAHALGGRAASTSEAGFHINLGPHAWYVAGPGTAVLERLGIPLQGNPPKPAANFALVDGRAHAMPMGFVSLLTTDLLGLHGKFEAARVQPHRCRRHRPGDISAGAAAPAGVTDGRLAGLARASGLQPRDRRAAVTQTEGYVGQWLPGAIETGDESASPGYEVVSDELSTEHRYDLLESVSMAFMLALEHLTPRQRAVLILRDVSTTRCRRLRGPCSSPSRM